jgi:hypothetical protein
MGRSTDNRISSRENPSNLRQRLAEHGLTMDHTTGASQADERPAPLSHLDHSDSERTRLGSFVGWKRL